MDQPVKRSSKKGSKRGSRKVDLTQPKIAWIHAILDNVDKDMRISKRAVYAVVDLCHNMASNICVEAAKITHSLKKKTVGMGEVLTACKTGLPMQLLKTVEAHAFAAVQRCEDENLKVEQSKLGLIFGVGQSRNLLKSKSNLKVSTTALVFIAAMQEAICRKFLIKAVERSKDMRMVTVKLDQAAFVGKRDEEFSKFWNSSA